MQSHAAEQGEAERGERSYRAAYAAIARATGREPAVVKQRHRRAVRATRDADREPVRQAAGG